jgi:hypothetical protein
MNPRLLAEFEYLVRAGRDEITMDDVTRCGEIALDPNGDPNAGQNGLGSFLPTLAKRGWVERTDRVLPSRSPRRKGGTQRIWRITDKARRELGP